MAKQQGAGRRRIVWQAVSTALAFLLMASVEAPRAKATHSPDGKLVYSTGDNVFVCPFPREGAFCLGIDVGAQNLHPTLSPDAERVAHAHNGTIRVTDLDTLERTDLTDTGRDFWPVWSPDGQTIYFHRFEPNPPEPPAPPNVDVYRVPSDDSAPAEPFAASDNKIQGLPAVAENGNVAAYTTDIDGTNGRVEILDPAGDLVQTTGPVPDGEVNALVPGSWILTVTDTATGERRVYRTDEDTNMEFWEFFEGATPAGGASLIRISVLGGGRYMASVEEPADNPGVFVCTQAGCETEPEVAGDTRGFDAHGGTPDGEEPAPGDPPTMPPDDPPTTTPDDTDVTPPVEPALVYDLRLLHEGFFLPVALLRKDRTIEASMSVRMRQRVLSDVRSLRESLPTTLHLRTPAPFRFDPLVQHVVTGEPIPDTCSAMSDAGGSGVDCDIDPLAPGGVSRGHVQPVVRGTRSLTEAHHRTAFPYTWFLVCKPPHESDCSNNETKGLFQLSFPPGSKITGIGTSRARGRAQGPRTPARGSGSQRLSAASAKRPRRSVKRPDRPARVQVALVRLRKGQRGFRGAPEPALPPDLARAAGNGQRQCSWLANRKGRFKKNRVGAKNTCDNPIWVRAKLGKRARKRGAGPWALKWKKPLRRGRYVLYSRATTRWGMPEVTFTKKRGNRVAFRVRKRR